MKYVIVNKNGKRLNGINTNDLPTTKKLYFNEKTDKLEPKFTLKNMFTYYSDCYTVFNSEAEAIEYLQYNKDSLMQQDNVNRYESALKGSVEKLLKEIDNLKVVLI